MSRLGSSYENDDTRTWVVAIVPDGTTNVTATGTDGEHDAETDGDEQ